MQTEIIPDHIAHRHRNRQWHIIALLGDFGGFFTAAQGLLALILTGIARYSFILDTMRGTFKILKFEHSADPLFRK